MLDIGAEDFLVTNQNFHDVGVQAMFIDTPDPNFDAFVEQHDQEWDGGMEEARYNESLLVQQKGTRRKLVPEIPPSTTSIKDFESGTQGQTHIDPELV